MKLNDVDILELLPGWMQEDASIKALAIGTNEEAKRIFNLTGVLTRWDKINTLDEGYLDSLARELNIPWYRTDASIETKRRIILNSDLVHKILGTKKAVEMVVNDYFEDGEVREWFEYGGDPYHFRVVSENSASVEENAAMFLQLLDAVKRKSAWLDALAVLIEEDSGVYAGVAYQDVEKLTIVFNLEEEPT